jgi:H+/gluconate symporter-like permease
MLREVISQALVFGFVLAYVGCIIAIIIYALRLLGRFVRAHERVAGALEVVARKLRDDSKP